MHIRKKLSLLALALAACAEDPSENAPQARVGEATEESPTPTPADGELQHLDIDRARSSVGFTGSKVSASHDGRFDEFSGTIDLDPETLENSRVNVTIQMASVQIDPDRLRSHLTSADFFDVERYPTATFESTRIVRGGENATHTITGNLTLHGRSRAVTFPANVELTDADVHARAEFTINRRDFDIVYPGMPDDLIRDGVVVRFDVRASRASGPRS
jgi:polyisoprenoid-binding protein YceI